MADTLNQREQKMVRLINKGMLPTDAAEQTYNVKSRPGARSIASRFLKKKKVLNALKKAGLDYDSVSSTIVDAMKNADKIIVDKNGHEHIQPHYMVRLAAAVQGAKLLGMFEEPNESGEAKQPLILKLVKVDKGVINIGQTPQQGTHNPPLEQDVEEM